MAWAWGGRTQTCLVGEKSLSHTVAHGLLDPYAQGPTHDGLGIKSAHKDIPESLSDTGAIHKEDDEAAHHIEDRHEGHYLFGDPGDPLDAAQKDKAGDEGDNDAYRQSGNPESGVEGVSDGVGLDHVAYKAQCQNEGYREETCQEFTEFPFK